MQFTSTLQNLPFRKNPRPGQAKVFAEVQNASRSLNIKLPTGYGKTFTACGCYSLLQRAGRANRLLYIVPTSKQLDQFEKDGWRDLEDAGVDGPLKVVDISFFSANALQRHRNNEAQVYATTIQAMVTKAGMDRVGELLKTGRWMVVVDEYHHYGIDAVWGRAVLALNYEFLLAMSATPNRPNEDSAFGLPDVDISYREAEEERAVKPLVGHSYVYRIDAVMPTGEVRSYTTSEIAEELGVKDGSPEKMEKMRIERKMRWSPKYVSPLVSIPIERMLTRSVNTGYLLQAIIGAMCVSHAKLVCEQISAMYPELCVDWVGTGDDGRSPEENKRVLSRFCPPKDDQGRRDPILEGGKWIVKIDGKEEEYVRVLVHVGMAGEGMDSLNVSEVVHLNPASVNNTNNQENGRAARYLPGVVGNINFDSSSEYAQKGYTGDAIMDAMDMVPPRPSESGPCETCGQSPCACNTPLEIERLPDEPTIHIQDMEIITVDSGGVKTMEKIIASSPHFPTYSEADLSNPESGIRQFALELYRQMRAEEARQHDEKSRVLQWRESVKSALSVVTGRVISAMKKSSDLRVEKSLAGDIKKRINGRKKAILGEVTEDVEVCRRHYQWVKALESEVIDRGVPSWLL